MSTQQATPRHVLVHWEEEGLTSIVKTSQVVEPLPEKGSKANVKWGRRVLPATILAIGNKAELKRKQEEFHKNGCEAEVPKDSDDTPPKKRKCAETTANKQVKKGKKGVNILCVTQPPEQESEGPTTPGITHNGPTTAGIAPDGPTSGIAHDGPTTIQATSQLALTLQKISDEVQAQWCTLHSIETYMQQRFMEIQVLHDLQAAKILELQGKLENQESQPDSTDTRENGLEQSLRENELSPAVVQMCHREAFRDVENLPYLHSTPTSALPQLRSNPVSTCNPPELKTAADVIGNNQKLLQTTEQGWMTGCEVS